MVAILCPDVLSIVENYRREMETYEFRIKLGNMYRSRVGRLDEEFEECLQNAHTLRKMGIRPRANHYMTILELYWNS